MCVFTLLYMYCMYVIHRNIVYAVVGAFVNRRFPGSTVSVREIFWIAQSVCNLKQNQYLMQFFLHIKIIY